MKFPPGYGDYGLDEGETRDRTFTPALEAQEARERGHSTDPNWRPDLWPTEPPKELDTKPWEELFAGPQQGGTRIENGTVSWPSPTAGTTIDPPPTADLFSPAQRAELERILLDADVFRERLRKLLERA